VTVDVATRPEAIYVLHACEKKTQKTSAHDLQIGRERFRAIAKLRQQHAKRNQVRVTPSTGTVFRDLGFSKDESEHLVVPADLLIQVQTAIASKGLSRQKRRKCFVSRSRV
jgi:hypothetical protein